MQMRGITQLSLAERARCTRAHVSNVLTGKDRSARVLAVALEMIREHDAAKEHR